MVGERRLADMEQGGEVRVPKKDISEPSFGFGRGGDREFVLPGNREYVAGDRIARPQGGGGGGGNGSGGDGDSEDAFVFSLSREEFMQIFFDDLELPQSRAHRVRPHRAAHEHARRLHEDRRAGQPRDRAHAAAIAGAADRARRQPRARARGAGSRIRRRRRRSATRSTRRGSTRS